MGSTGNLIPERERERERERAGVYIYAVRVIIATTILPEEQMF